MARPETEVQVPLQVRRAAQLLWLLVALMAVASCSPRSPRWAASPRY